MALGDFKGNDSIYLLIMAALFGAVVKTTADRGSWTSEGRSAAGKGSKDEPQPKRAGEPRKGDVVDAQLGPPLFEGQPEPSDARAFVRRQLRAPAGDAHLAVVVALLPDPATSGFVQAFDDGLDAIQQAARSQHFTVYRHWLPWQRDGSAVQERKDVDKAGWLLFRQDVVPDEGEGGAPAPRLLLVLVVGERLGSGVNPLMLGDALQLRAELDGQAPARILGPYYPWTAASLRAGLESWCASLAVGCAGRTADLVSGTAIRPTSARVLQDVPGLKVRFHVTVNRDADLMRGMQTFLRGALGVEAGHIAELSEISTAVYGNRASNAGDPARRPWVDPTSLRISYPTHLPDLRVTRPGAPPPAPDFRDDLYSVDVVPLFKLETLAASRQMLAGTIEALRRQLITDAGIVAIGINDKISLVTALREAAPDVRPHLYGANLALADPAWREVMDGTLVASSYPLSTATQIWSGSHRVQQFVSEAAEGIYNALLALLSDGSGRLANGEKLEEALLDYAYPFGPGGGAGPPVWISVIVGGQIWPLAAYRVDAGPADSNYLFPVPAPRPSLTMPRGRFAVVGLLLLLVVVAGNLLSLVRVMRPLRRWPFLLMSDRSETRGEGTSFLFLEPLATREGRAPRVLGIWVTAIAGSASAALYEIPWFANQHVSLGWTDAVAALLLLCSLLLFLAPMGHFQLNVRWAWRPVAMLVSLIVLGIRFYAFTHPAAHAADGRAFLFFARMVHPELGMAPALPLMFLAIAIYVSCLFRLRALRCGIVLRAAAPCWARSGVPGVAEDLGAFSQASLRSLGSVVWVGTLLGLALFMWLRAGSLEGPTFDFLVAVGFGLTYSIAIASIARVDQLWRRMRALLRSLAAHPWAPAFGRLPDHVSQAFRTPLPGALSRDEITRDCEVVATLADANPLPGAAAGAPAGSRLETYLAELQPIWNSAGARPPALAAKDEPERPLAVQLREHYLAIQMTQLLSQMCDVTRTTLFVGAVAAVAAVLAMTVYPFQSAGTLAWAAPITIVLVVLSAVRLMTGVERNELLSRIAQTEAGRLTLSWALVVRLVGYVGVPLASLGAAALPNHDLIAKILRSLNGSIQP